MIDENIYCEIDGLIYKIAKTFTSDKTLLEDLYQQGMIGVLKAQKNYNPSQGVDFKAYAKMYIYGEIHSYFNGVNKTFKTSKDVIKLYKLISKTNELLTQELKRKPTTSEIASYLELSCTCVEDTLKIMQSTLSLNYEYENADLESFVSYSDSYTNIEIDELMKSLNDSEKKVIEYKYIEGYTQEEIARMMDMSQSSVSRCEHEGIARMRQRHINSIRK